jgi:deoxycytidine triphosphate deaminase
MNTQPQHLAKVPSSREEAQQRYIRYKSVDPFPSVPPALLNSADIFDYIVTTGMIYPFYPDKLGSATYEINLLNKWIYWDENGQLRSDLLKQGEIFKLKRNSIAFVSLETEFLIPDYIALRFNLRISYIHKGILLGTGPIVDPGFVGSLLIPLHNLTTNDYELKGGDCLIKVEFTKLSPNERWLSDQDGDTRTGEYEPFKASSQNLSPEDYLRRASPDPIRSSIPTALKEALDHARVAEKKAQEAEEHAKNIDKRARNVAIISLFGLILGLVGILLNVYSMINNVNSRIDSVSTRTNADRAADNKDIQYVKSKSDQQAKDLELLSTKGDKQSDDLRRMEDEIKALKQRVK